ncbi:hypothetical protein CLV96_3261 [Leptospira meyeri]|uniref:Uncharacterized protein n=1 Tax=Leptospira meyeri TaxID=29508 RepID=A0A4R8MMG9_LEPME|nr:hypothetical protein [Leptospira meyeri]EKJ87004.1 hypothetical protein LEP1GSC017_0809 [Leptospira meyeri serovar Hardjo str. Went 5]TDY68743.1 hypothetical protein CLV96_3261 [Leptospira meyeri]
MKNIITAILLLLFSFQCKIFKPSDLDPSQDLGSLQSLLRLLALADAFNTYSQTVAFMKFTDSNGNPYNAYKVEYSVFNEADENGVPVSDYGETGNIRTYTLTLDPNGRGFLTFSERGIATLTVKTPGDVIVGSTSFRIYNGITKQSFSLLTQGGIVQFLLEDIANYRNQLASNYSFTPLGSANGRQFIYLEVLTSYAGPDKNSAVGYIASSADGENYDLVTKIDGVTIEKNISYELILKISKPVFNGAEYVFFISEEKRNYPALTYLSTKNFVFKIPNLFPPGSNIATSLPIATNAFLFTDPNYPSWMYPTIYLGNGRYVITPTYYPAVEKRPTLLNADFGPTADLISDFSCQMSTFENDAIAYQVATLGGIEYLQCPSVTLSTIAPVRSLDTYALNNNPVNFDGSGLTFQSPVFFARGKFVSLLGTSPPVGYTFPTGNYTSPSPTILRNTSFITGFSSSLAPSYPLLRDVKSSGNSDFLILSTVPTFSTPSIEIFRSIDSLASVTVLPSIPTAYSTGISNAEQLQSANGKLNYSYSISEGTGVGSFPVYLTYFTNDSGTWEALPRLIKIR